LFIDDKNFIDLLSKAQNYSLHDQRGKIDSANLEIPNFLLTNNLLKNQSLSQSLISNQSVNSGYYNNSKLNDVSGHTNKSLLLPITSSASLNSLPIINYQTLSGSTSKTINQNYMCSSRSRSPIVIVYDYEDFDGINGTAQNNNSIIYEENKNFNNFDNNNSHSNKFKSSTSSINHSYTSNNQYNHNSSIKTNRTINSNNSTRLNDIDEYSGQYISSKQPISSAPSLNNSQISYV
jgi:hypothetical protein